MTRRKPEPMPEAEPLAERSRLVPPPLPPDCPHRRTEYIQGSRSSKNAYREHVTVCCDCGEFQVLVNKAGVWVDIRFVLVTPEAIRAAGVYLEGLRAGEPFA